MSNLGKWDEWYKGLYAGGVDFSYGDGTTYLMAAAFLADVDVVEDWGCGTGLFKRYCRTKYVGLDGSQTPFADQICDLVRYRSGAPGILLRHVLEHNYAWATILENAVASFQKKICLILFTPFADTTHEIANSSSIGIDVPDLSFSRSDIEQYLVGLQWTIFEAVPTKSHYRMEHVYLIWRD